MSYLIYRTDGSESDAAKMLLLMMLGGILILLPFIQVIVRKRAGSQANTTRVVQNAYITFDEAKKRLEVFEQAFTVDRYIRIPIADVKNEEVKKAWEIFKSLIGSHPDEGNTEIIFLNKKGLPWEWDLLFVCSHFEDSHLLEIIGLASVLGYLNQVSTGGDSAHINLLNTHGEKLIIEVLDIDIGNFEAELASYKPNLPSEQEK